MGDILVDTPFFGGFNTTESSTAHFHNVSTYGTTIAPDDRPYPVAVGYVAVAVTVLLFGSNNVPIKKFETGDGVFYQWILCAAVWCSGFVLNAVRGFPPFCPLALLGGFLFCTGNMMTVPIIKTIGLGQGMLIWASFNLVSGWAGGRFGWFGIKPEIPSNPTLNYIGVSLCFVSAFIYMLLKTNTSTLPQSASSGTLDDEIEEPLVEARPFINESTMEDSNSGLMLSVLRRMNPVTKRILGTTMAVCAGILYGFNFTPIIYMQDNDPDSSRNGLDYVFSHFCGIFLSSSVYFFIYCIATCNKPLVYRSAILPGIISGVMWAIADIGWFIANDVLSEPISFPMVLTGPSIIGTLWGIVFKEISGRKNYLILLVAFAVAITGSVLTGLSKIG